ncbi:hypothetical protein ALNOE001_20560 [Candidatus Methanobinarius endosymbioticus]|uniref:DUF1922 domain-containing protein n=1 Tax=Candidatus Methanobinarius endosymbioticus TaxID=2006182 RepID=A0A366M9C0_9EURY|nr:hypothetical protein ALNOE001_20560 [Candidatus Methanobinarius endosymbioticus]
MYFIFRCDCGRVLYAKEGVATRKCVCGKFLKVKERRIFKKVETTNQASEAVRNMQEEIYGGTAFKKANELQKNKKFKEITFD